MGSGGFPRLHRHFQWYTINIELVGWIFHISNLYPQYHIWNFMNMDKIKWVQVDFHVSTGIFKDTPSILSWLDGSSTFPFHINDTTYRILWTWSKLNGFRWISMFTQAFSKIHYQYWVGWMDLPHFHVQFVMHVGKINDFMLIFTLPQSIF